MFNQSPKQNEEVTLLSTVFFLFFLLFACFVWLVVHEPSLVTPFCIVVFCIFSLLRPERSYFLLLIFMFISSFFFQLNQNDKIRPEFLDFFILCSALSWFFRGVAQDRKPYSPNNPDIIIFIFVIWAVVSLIWTPDKDQGIFEAVKLITCIAVYVLTKSLLTNKDMLRKVIVVITITGVFEGLLSLVSIWSDSGYNWSQSITYHVDFLNFLWANKTMVSGVGRGSGTGAPHMTGALLNMVIFLAIGYFLVSKSSKKKWSLIISVFIMTSGMISTLTKSSMASFLGGAVFILIHIRKLRGYLFISLLLLLAFFILSSGVSRMRDIERSINFTQHQMDSGDSKTSMGTRRDWWGEGMKKLTDTAGLGYGIGGFRAAIDNVMPDGSHHAVLFDLGLLGFSLYIFILGCSFLEYYRHLQRCRVEYFRRLMLAYLAGYLVMVASWIVTLYYTYAYIWFYMGLGYAIIHLSDIAEKEHTEKTEEDSFVAMPTDSVW